MFSFARRASLPRVAVSTLSAWLLSAIAVALLAGLTAGLVVDDGGAAPAPLVGFIGVAVLVGALLLGRRGGVAWAVGLVVTGWAMRIVVGADDGSALDPAAVLVAAVSLVAAETAYWSMEPTLRRRGAPVLGAVAIRRAADLLALALGSAAVALGMLILAASTSGRSLALAALGVTALLLLLALIVRLAFRVADAA